MSKRAICKIVLLAGGLIASMAGAQQRTLRDFGQIDQDIEYENKLKTLNELRQKNSAPAPAAAGNAAASAVVVPVIRKAPRQEDKPLGVRLRAVLGVNDRLRGVFLRANGSLIQCPVHCTVDGWAVAEVAPSYAKLVRGKKTYVMEVDPPIAPRIVTVDQGYSGSEATTGNRVNAAPLPSPRIAAQVVPNSTDRAPSGTQAQGRPLVVPFPQADATSR